MIARRGLSPFLAAGLLAALAALPGCAQTGNIQAGEVVLSEWRVQAKAPTGNALAVRNVGQRPHQLVVSKPGGQVLASTELLQPGQSAALVLAERGELELTSGYVTTEADGTVINDALNGMVLAVNWPS